MLIWSSHVGVSQPAANIGYGVFVSIDYANLTFVRTFAAVIIVGAVSYRFEYSLNGTTWFLGQDSVSNTWDGVTISLTNPFYVRHNYIIGSKTSKWATSKNVGNVLYPIDITLILEASFDSKTAYRRTSPSGSGDYYFSTNVTVGAGTKIYAGMNLYDHLSKLTNYFETGSVRIWHSKTSTLFSRNVTLGNGWRSQEESLTTAGTGQLYLTGINQSYQFPVDPDDDISSRFTGDPYMLLHFVNIY